MELFLSKLRAYKPQPSALRIFIIQFLTECLLRVSLYKSRHYRFSTE